MKAHYVVTKTDEEPSIGDSVLEKIVASYRPKRDKKNVWEVEDVGNYSLVKP